MRNFEGTPAHTVYSVVKETFNLEVPDRMDILYLDRVKTKKKAGYLS